MFLATDGVAIAPDFPLLARFCRCARDFPVARAVLPLRAQWAS
jgi:hypothetical protein